jgi:hypothetical protein
MEMRRRVVINVWILMPSTMAMVGIGYLREVCRHRLAARMVSENGY